MIAERARDGDRPPSLEEIAWRLGLRSVAAARQVVVALERKGYLRREPRRRRALSLLRWPDEATRAPEMYRLPLVGDVSAGRPIEAIEGHVEGEWIAATWVDRPDCFLLRVRGHSMLGDGVLDGDLVVVAPASEVAQGEMAVVLLTDGSATLKRVYREKGHVRLQPANPYMEPIVVPTVTIGGRVVAVIRRLRSIGRL